MDSTRQNKISRLIQKELADYFQKESRNSFSGKIISVTVVRVTPDLLEAKVYLSIFPADNSTEILQKIELMNKEIRHNLAKRVAKQLRKVPELRFFIDDSLEYAQKIDDLLK